MHRLGVFIAVYTLCVAEGSVQLAKRQETMLQFMFIRAQEPQT